MNQLWRYVRISSSRASGSGLGWTSLVQISSASTVAIRTGVDALAATAYDSHVAHVALIDEHRPLIAEAPTPRRQPKMSRSRLGCSGHAASRFCRAPVGRLRVLLAGAVSLRENVNTLRTVLLGRPGRKLDHAPQVQYLALV